MGKNINFDNHIHAGIMAENSRAEEFIKIAIDKGLSEIGITDHAPFPQFRAGDRIPVGQTAAYCRRVRELAHKYRDRIDIRLGIEMDYHPSLTAQIEEMLDEGDFDFVIGSSHLHIPCMLERKLSELSAQEYVDLSLENNLKAVESGYFDVIAHLDMYRWVIEKQERFKLRGTEYVLDEGMLCKLFSEMAKRGTALEINTHRIGGGVSLIYPDAEIMKIAAKYPIYYSFGSDAHTPGQVGHGVDAVSSLATFAHCLDNFADLSGRARK